MHFLSLWNVKSCVSVNLWWLAVLLTLPFPLLTFLIWQLLLEVCWSPTVTAIEANSPWVSSSFSPYVLEQKVNNCDVVLWMCQSGPAGGSAVVSAKPSISFLNLISYKLCGILAP